MILKPVITFALVLAGAVTASGGDFKVKVKERKQHHSRIS